MPQDGEPADAEALRRRVEERAYALWESEGRPHTRDLDHWRQAEAEIMGAGETALGATPPNSTASPARAKTKAESSAD